MPGVDLEFFAKEDIRLRIYCVLEYRDRCFRLPRLGPPYVRQRPVNLCWYGVFVPDNGRGGAVRDQDV